MEKIHLSTYIIDRVVCDDERSESGKSSNMEMNSLGYIVYGAVNQKSLIARSLDRESWQGWEAWT